MGGLNVPQAILDVVEPIKDNDEAVRNFGINFATDICRKILESGTSYGLHFYTLNREVNLTDTMELSSDDLSRFEQNLNSGILVIIEMRSGGDFVVSECWTFVSSVTVSNSDIIYFPFFFRLHPSLF